MVPSPENQQFARRLIERFGKKGAARRIGLSVPTLSNIAGGLVIIPATNTHVTVMRAELGPELAATDSPPPIRRPRKRPDEMAKAGGRVGTKK